MGPQLHFGEELVIGQLPDLSQLPRASPRGCHLSSLPFPPFPLSSASQDRGQAPKSSSPFQPARVHGSGGCVHGFRPCTYPASSPSARLQTSASSTQPPASELPFGSYCRLLRAPQTSASPDCFRTRRSSPPRPRPLAPLGLRTRRPSPPRPQPPAPLCFRTRRPSPPRLRPPAPLGLRTKRPNPPWPWPPAPSLALYDLGLTLDLRTQPPVPP